MFILSEGGLLCEELSRALNQIVLRRRFATLSLTEVVSQPLTSGLKRPLAIGW